MASKGIEYWTSQWRDDHGRRRKKTFGRVDRVTEAAASRVYAEWLVDWFSQADVQTPISVITMTEFFTRYTSHAQVYYRRKDKTPTSEVDRIWHACNRMSLLFGRMPASDVQPQHLLGFRQSLIDGGLMRTTVNAYVSIIKRAYKWGKNQGMVAGKAYDAIRDIGELTAGRSEAEDPEKIVGVPWAIVEATLHHMPDVVRTMVMLQWHTEGNWEHRAYWGEDLIGWGTPAGSAAHFRAGDLPTPGQWVMLTVPASALGLATKSLDGMAFALFDGRAAYGLTGARTPQVWHSPADSVLKATPDGAFVGDLPPKSQLPSLPQQMAKPVVELIAHAW